MKTKGCMFIALIISGAAFGQQAAVKQSVKVDSKTQVNSSSASGKAEIKADSRVDGSAAHGGQTAANTGAKTEIKSGNSTEGASAQGNGTASASGKAEIKADSRVEGSATNGGEGAVSNAGAASLTQETNLSGKENGILSTELTNAAEGAINTGGNGRGTLLTELNAAGDGALEHVSANSSAAVEATLNTATEIEASSTQNLEKVNDRLIKTGAAAKGIGAGLNTTVNNALKIKAAPLKINTRIVGGAGLGIF